MLKASGEPNALMRLCVIAFAVLVSVALVTGSVILLFTPKPTEATKVSFKPVRVEPQELR